MYEAKVKATGKRFAVKITKAFNKNDFIDYRQEAEILQVVKHPNIIDFFGNYESTKEIFTVLELLDGGELFDRIVKKTQYNEKEARDIVCTVLSAIKCCHDQNIVHRYLTIPIISFIHQTFSFCRDLKPENLLMTTKFDDAQIKLADFGFATKVEGLSLTKRCGSPAYVAPEILAKKNYG